MMPVIAQIKISIHWNIDDKKKPPELTWDTVGNNDTDYGHGNDDANDDDNIDSSIDDNGPDDCI